MLKKHIAAPRTPLAKLQYGKPDEAKKVDLPTSPATSTDRLQLEIMNEHGSSSGDEVIHLTTPKTQLDTEWPVAQDEHDLEISLGAIDVSPYQPRLVFEEEAIRELAESIEESGLINPILVRQKANGRYELVAGERRYRAHQVLRRLTIKATLRKLSDEAACLEALTDNEARENLCDYERGRSYNRILTGGLVKSQGDLCRKIGVAKATVSRCLSYFKLPPEAIEILDRHPTVLGGTKAAEFASDYFASHRDVVVEAIRMLAESQMTEDAALVWAKGKVKTALGLDVPIPTRSLTFAGRRLGEFKVEGRKIVITCAKGVDPEEIATVLNKTADD
nr:ParB/RepB/Spo0J family partition protein [uncultured Noviherbaspirillum sp.]